MAFPGILLNEAAAHSIDLYQVSGEIVSWYYQAFDERPDYFNVVSRIIQSADDIIDLDFEYTSDKEAADLRIFVGDALDPSRGGEDALGYFMDLLYFGEIEIYIHPGESIESNTNSFLHEFGHYLGLGEPGYDTRFDQAFTAMSYNANDTIDGGWQTFFTDNDIEILLQLHGAEDDHLPADGVDRSDQDNIPLLNRIIGTARKDKLKGTGGDDEIIGFGGADKIMARGGDDLIDPGQWTSGKFDKVKGGAGADTFIIKDGYWVFVKDFNMYEDKLDVAGVSGELGWEIRKNKTFLFDGDDYEVARFIGKINFSDVYLGLDQ